jgi:DNA-binding winged helix-turn-helix (wHTH) protein
LSEAGLDAAAIRTVYGVGYRFVVPDGQVSVAATTESVNGLL